MTSVMDNTGKLLEYRDECEKNGTAVLCPDINKSGVGFTADSDGIRFSLLAVKNLGRNAVENIVKERRSGGLFSSLSNFCERMNGKDINRKAVENLIKCGAFDSFSLNRRQMLENYDKIFEGLQASVRHNIEGQINFFELSAEKTSGHEEMYIPDAEEYELKVLLELERESLGMYVSGHPLDGYKYFSRIMKHIQFSELSEKQNMFKDGVQVKIICIIQNVKQHKTRAGAVMAFVSAEDTSGEGEFLFFPELYSSNMNLIKNGAVVFVEGKVSAKDGEIKIIAEKVLDADSYIRYCSKQKLYIKCNSTDSEKVALLLRICAENSGNSQAVFYFEDLRKYVKPKTIAGVSITEKFLCELVNVVNIENIALAN